MQPHHRLPECDLCVQLMLKLFILSSCCADTVRIFDSMPAVGFS